MKISLNWLKRYVDLPESPKEIADSLTLLGFEVDDIDEKGLPALENVVVGQVLEREQHPNADRLGVCRVDVGAEIGEKSIVCGATNYKVGDRVPVALPGAELPGGFKIKRSKLRGVESDGMMCSGKEIGASEDAQGLLILEGEPALGTPINDVLSDSDVVFTLEVTPNRPDCLSHVGIARELAAWYRRPLTYPDVESMPALESCSHGADLLSDVTVDCEEDCPLYLARIIRGVKIGPSPAWMQELLSSIGLRPINNVVDVTNFVMHECGNPLHAFDARDIGGGKIRVRNAQDGEVITTLDDVERKLSSRMVVIADEQKALAVAGVMGGQNSEVKEDTTDLILEIAYFKPSTIRWVSKKLGLSSDSSYRFERGVDPQSLAFAAERAVELILQTAGGELCQPAYTVGKAPAWENEIEVSPDWLRKKAGFDMDDDAMRKGLESLELEVRANDNESWRVGIPSHRGDLDRPIDILEETLRLHGTHQIPSGVVKATANPVFDNPITEYNRAASNYLVGQRFVEAVNYTLRSEAEQTNWASSAAAAELALSNPISEDQTQLRHSLLPGLLETLKLNQYRKTGATRFFETGRIFREMNGKVVELIAVAFLECSEGQERQWKSRDSEDFYQAKAHLARLASFAGFDISRFALKPVSVNSLAWQEGHSAALDEPKAGFSARMGLMNLARTKEMDIQGEVIAGIFTALPSRLRKPKRIKFKPFSAFPSATRDLALVVDKNELAGDVMRGVSKIAAKAAKGAFELEKVDVFDVYEGQGVPEGKKSLAVSMAFRSQERTLTDDEVNKAFEATQEGIRQQTSYEIRD